MVIRRFRVLAHLKTMQQPEGNCPKRKESKITEENAGWTHSTTVQEGGSMKPVW